MLSSFALRRLRDAVGPLTVPARRLSSCQEITRYAIYPSVGVSRVGNSDEYFYAPEVPGRTDPRVPLAPDSEPRFKDDYGRVKRQAARFRVFGFDADGNAVKEVTADVGEVEWEVHIANRKSAWYQFHNALDLVGKDGKNLGIPCAQRNEGTPRKLLVNDPGSASIKGCKQVSRDLIGSPAQVNLGQLRTDEKGRLVVLGGLGRAGSSGNQPIVNFANNPGWWDDVSDGTVRAKVKLADSDTWVEVEKPAVVVVSPPNYAPGIDAPTTMYDLVTDVYTRNKFGDLLDDARTSFKEHVWPIFNQLTQTQYVSEGYDLLFGSGSPADFRCPKVFAKLTNTEDADTEAGMFRRKLFDWFRKPAASVLQPAMLPPFYGDAFGDYSTQPGQGLSVTPTQYAHLKNWRDGNFDADMEELPAPFVPELTQAEEDPLASINDLEEQTRLLNKAGLGDMLGGPFHPGVEITWIFRVPGMWEDPDHTLNACPIRLKTVDKASDVEDDYGAQLTPDIALCEKHGPLSATGPGTLTRWSAVPWHTDTSSCLDQYDFSTYLPLPAFWSARAPNEVLSEFAFNRANHPEVGKTQKLKHLNHRQWWLRDLGAGRDNPQLKVRMIQKWDQVGIIAPRKTSSELQELGYPPHFWVETERNEKFDPPLKRAPPTTADPVDATRTLIKRAQDIVGAHCE